MQIKEFETDKTLTFTKQSQAGTKSKTKSFGEMLGSSEAKTVLSQGDG